MNTLYLREMTPLKRLIWLSRLKKLSGGSSAVEKTESGSLVHITDALAKPVKRLVANIDPVQDLHGQSSPYPAGGGSNIFDEEVEIGGLSTSNGGNINQTDRKRSKNYIGVSAETTYYYYSETKSAHFIYYYDSSNTFLSVVDMGSNNGAFTTPENCAYVRFMARTTDLTIKTAINYPSTVDTYSPYSNICPIAGYTETNVYRSDADTSNPTTYSPTFPAEAGTVYGATLTNYGTDEWKLMVTKANIASYNGETLPSTWISDRDVYAAGATPTTGAQVVYDLAAPIEYTLTNEEAVTLLAGENNIWADAGDVEVTYLAEAS